MIDPYTVKPSELGFSWVDDAGKYHCWMTDRMNRYAESHMEPDIIEVDYDYALWAMVHNGIERHRVDRLTPQVLAQKPIINVQFEDGSYKLVDGNHRYVKAMLLGWKEIRSYLFNVEQGNMFKLDIPDHLNEECKKHIPSFSGIL